MGAAAPPQTSTAATSTLARRNSTRRWRGGRGWAGTASRRTPHTEAPSAQPGACVASTSWPDNGSDGSARRHGLASGRWSKAGGRQGERRTRPTESLCSRETVRLLTLSTAARSRRQSTDLRATPSDATPRARRGSCWGPRSWPAWLSPIKTEQPHWQFDPQHLALHGRGLFLIINIAIPNDPAHILPSGDRG